MEFIIKKKSYGVELTVLCGDERLSDCINHFEGDIRNSYISSIADCLREIIEIRKKPFDSSELIESLFDKLTEEQASNLSAILYERHFQTQI